MKPKTETVFFFVLSIVGAGYLLFVLYTGYQHASAFTGPSTTAGTGSGLITADSSGRLGIGTASPGEKLEINGNLKLSGASPTYTIKNVAAPVNSSDAATKGYVDSVVSAGSNTKYITWIKGQNGNWQTGCFSPYGSYPAASCPSGWSVVQSTNYQTGAPGLDNAIPDCWTETLCSQ